MLKLRARGVRSLANQLAARGAGRAAGSDEGGCVQVSDDGSSLRTQALRGQGRAKAMRCCLIFLYSESRGTPSHPFDAEGWAVEQMSWTKTGNGQPAEAY